MSRLLFAAARGARIEFFASAGDRYVCPVIDRVPLDAVHRGYYRIHPDDEHLQYGPISSALREFADNGREPYTVSGYAAMQIFRYECWYPFVLRFEWFHAQMFALILAEALADEGL